MEALRGTFAGYRLWNCFVGHVSICVLRMNCRIGLLQHKYPINHQNVFFLYVWFCFFMFLPINQQKRHTPWGKLVVCSYACGYSHKCTVPLLTSPSLSPSPCPKRDSNIWLSTLKIHFHFDFYSCRRNWKLRFCSWRERQQTLFTLFT